MDEKAQAVSVTPLLGTERACFEQHRDRLCAAYVLQVQGLVDEWEATSEAVGALRRKRFLDVHMGTFFGSITFRVHQGLDRSGRWVSPDLLT